MNTNNEEISAEKSKKRELRERFKRLLGVIQKRNGLSHKELATKTRFKPSSVSSWSAYTEKDIPLDFVLDVYKNGLCDDEEYRELVQILISTNDRLTLDLAQIRADFKDINNRLQHLLKLEPNLAAIICGKFAREIESLYPMLKDVMK